LYVCRMRMVRTRTPNAITTIQNNEVRILDQYVRGDSELEVMRWDNLYMIRPHTSKARTPSRSGYCAASFSSAALFLINSVAPDCSMTLCFLKSLRMRVIVSREDPSNWAISS